MSKIAVSFTLFVLLVVCTTSFFGQAVASQTAAKPTPTESFSGDTIAAATTTDNPYRIGTQDVLDIRVFKHPELNQTVAVGPLGTIALFRMQQPIVAVCKTARELANDIVVGYRDKEKYLRDPQVQVMVQEQRSSAFAVIGAVEKPGNYFISQKIQLLELLARAGGPNKEAGTRLLVARAGSVSNCQEATSSNDDGIEVMGFKLRDVQEGKQTLVMKPGDVVSVLDADIVYVYGNVNKQGALKIREPITLTQALASAEGLKPAANKGKIRVLRQTPGKADRDEFVFDLSLIDKGKVKDPFLEPNDIVAVSEDKAKAILKGITTTLKNTVPSAAYRL